MVGQVFFFLVFFLSFSSFRFPLYGLLYIWMDHSYSLSDHQRSRIGDQELWMSIDFNKKNGKRRDSWPVFFFFLLFSSFQFSSHFMDSFIIGWNNLIQPQTPEGSQKTDGKYILLSTALLLCFLSIVVGRKTESSRVPGAKTNLSKNFAQCSILLSLEARYSEHN